MDDSFTITPDFDGHDLEISGAHGDILGHIVCGPGEATLVDAHGAHVGYAYDFGGVDYLIDQHHQLGATVDSLGVLHDADGATLAHLYNNEFGIGPELIDQHNHVIATILERMGPA